MHTFSESQSTIPSLRRPVQDPAALWRGSSSDESCTLYLAWPPSDDGSAKNDRLQGVRESEVRKIDKQQLANYWRRDKSCQVSIILISVKPKQWRRTIPVGMRCCCCCKCCIWHVLFVHRLGDLFVVAPLFVVSCTAAL